MNGVRHVSNAIAHDLRTPLGRLRARLDEALRRETEVSDLADAARSAIEGIDDLILVFNKLLQIAEAESGMRAEFFEPVDLNRIVHDMGELYDAAAEERGVRLSVSGQDPVWTHGDHDLLASAVASLIDNAIKYAGPGSSVEVTARYKGQHACIVVQDDGPGVPPAELPKLTERQRSRPLNRVGDRHVARWRIATLQCRARPKCFDPAAGDCLGG
jgi:signal transduction histidine kinase